MSPGSLMRSSAAWLAVLLAVAVCTVPRPASAQPAPASAGPADPKLIEDLVAASRILADHGLLDGWGHVSVRHDKDPNRFLMSRGLSAEFVTAKDIIEFDLDSRPVDTHGLPMSALFTERYIHSEIYKARPDVIAVVHTARPLVDPVRRHQRPAAPYVSPLGFHRFWHPGVRNPGARRHKRHVDPKHDSRS